MDLERAAAASPVPWPAVRQLQQGKTDLEQAQATANIASDLLGVGAAGLAVDAAREARGLYAGASGTSARASIRADGRRGRSDGSTRSPAEGLVDCDALEAHGLAALGREDDAVVLLTHAARRRRGSRRPCPRAADGVRTGRRARQPRPARGR